MKKLKKLYNKTLLISLIGALAGVAIVLGIRFATYQADSVHYHANFAVYINGQRETFSNPIYYTETACGGSDSSEMMTPYARAHMHEKVNDVIHVEDEAVTWGQFFDNLGWAVGLNFVQTSEGTIYAENGPNTLNIMLNGQDYTGLSSIANMVIHDRDRLLVSYGDVNQRELQRQYKTVASTAAKYDTIQDPSSCSGNHGGTMQDRIKHMF